MLSIEKCREILGDDAKDLTDEEIGELRSALYATAELALEVREKEREGCLKE